MMLFILIAGKFASFGTDPDPIQKNHDSFIQENLCTSSEEERRHSDSHGGGGRDRYQNDQYSDAETERGVRSVRLRRRRLRIAQPDSGLVFHQTNDI